MSAADAPMESAGSQEQPKVEPQEPSHPTEPPQSTELPQPTEPPLPERRQRKQRLTVATEDTEPPVREAKRPNRRMQTPPSIVVDQNFWSGLLATQRAMRREAKAHRFSNLAIV